MSDSELVMARRRRRHKKKGKSGSVGAEQLRRPVVSQFLPERFGRTGSIVGAGGGKESRLVSWSPCTILISHKPIPPVLTHALEDSFCA